MLCFFSCVDNSVVTTVLSLISFSFLGSLVPQIAAYLARPKCELSLEGKLLHLGLDLLLADLHPSRHVSSQRGLLDRTPPNQFAGGTFSANQGSAYYMSESALVLSIGHG